MARRLTTVEPTSRKLRTVNIARTLMAASMAAYHRRNVRVPNATRVP